VVSSVAEPGEVASDPFQRSIIAKEAPVDEETPSVLWEPILRIENAEWTYLTFGNVI